MRQTFREWYQPTDDEFSALWADALVVLDSSVLLGLYQYPPDTLDEFISVLDRVRDRLWVTHQIGLEYQKNREGRIPEQRAVLDRLLREIENLDSSLESLGIPEFHPTLSLGPFEERRTRVRDALVELQDGVRDAREALPDVLPSDSIEHDPLHVRVTELLENRVGEPFSADELARVKREGADRYANEVPPGFKDRNKDENRKFNDLIIWKQILALGRAGPDGTTRPCLFITNDRKEDWWRRKHDARIGPRTELIREYLDAVGEYFYMYTPGDFLSAAKQHLMLEVSAAVIEDVRRISSTSPATAILASRRMALPDSAARVSALNRLWEYARSEGLSVVADLNRAIEQLGRDFSTNQVATPLFFALVSEAYGPVHVDFDSGIRLRDRRIREIAGLESRDAFVEHAHSAWLAQALFRLRHEGLNEEELLVAFFGDDYPAESASLLRHAQELMEADVRQRAG